MTSKDIAIKMLQNLPDTATWADIEERIRFLSAMSKGLAAAPPTPLAPRLSQPEVPPQ